MVAAAGSQSASFGWQETTQLTWVVAELWLVHHLSFHRECGARLFRRVADARRLIVAVPAPLLRCNNLCDGLSTTQNHCGLAGDPTSGREFRSMLLEVD